MNLLNLVAEYFVFQSQIYPRFTGKVSTPVYIPFKQVCEDYTAVEEFEHGLDSIFMDFIKTLE